MINSKNIYLLLFILFFTTSSCKKEKTIDTKDFSKCPDFLLETYDGKNITLSTYSGKILFINFWASWCPPCRAEIPDFIDLYEKYKKDGFEILGINLDTGNHEKVRTFIEKNQINYTVAKGNENTVRSFGGITGIPTTFVVNREGYILEKFIGLRSKEVFETEIKKLLKNK